MILTIKEWLYTTKIWSWVYIYGGTIFTMIHLIIKHKFDVYKVNMETDMMKKDIKYQIKKMKEENIRLTRELDEKTKTKRL